VPLGGRSRFREIRTVARQRFSRRDVNCDEAINLASARLDGELSADDAAQLDAHVDACADCRAVAAELASVDAALDRAFASRGTATHDIATRVLTAFASERAASGNGSAIREATKGQTRMSTPPAEVDVAGNRRNRRFWANWGRPLAAAAAGFLLAIGLTRPWQKPTVPVAAKPDTTIKVTAPASRPVAQLALASGAVFTCPAGSEDWRPLATGGSVDAGCRVRTGPRVFCEFKMEDGSEVRLNARTQVTLAAPRRVDVAAGQVFSSVRRSPDAFVVRALPAETTLTALGTAFDVRCDAGAAADDDADSDATAAAPAPARRDATLTVVEGSVKVESAAGQSDVVRGGESLVCAPGRLTDKRQVENLMRATQWVDEILVMKGRDNPELTRRIDDIFAQLGHEKMWYLDAQEVRRLGDHCVVPLTRYIQSDRSKRTPEEETRRREAARIIGDVATTGSIPELINLLADDDGDVRYAAATALRRLTGSDHGRVPQQWRDQPLMTCAPQIQDWHAWWEKNKLRFPGADPDAVKPVEMVKQSPANLKKG
jgi:hypothetical protein